tara:strand:+ start:2112 stop:2537 length:426 start_codon:yes stop_codon:yes gene_type:complete
MLEYDISEIKRDKAYREISFEEFKSDDNRLEFFKLHRFYDSKKGKYYEMKCELNIMIFICSMFSGLPSITNDNVNRLAERIKFLECINESTYLKSYNPIKKVSENRPFTRDMIKEFVGLKTQGLTHTKAKFVSEATKGLKL